MARNISVDVRFKVVYILLSHIFSCILLGDITISIKGINAATPVSSRKLPIIIINNNIIILTLSRLLNI